MVFFSIVEMKIRPLSISCDVHRSLGELAVRENMNLLEET